MTCNANLYPEGQHLAGKKSNDKADRFSPDVMAGVTWMLTGWNPDEEAPRDPEISLVYKNGQFTGSAGCNRYFTDVTAGETPGSITVGMIGATRMMCPPPLADAETRFQRQLEGVTGFGFDNGRLVLSYMDGTTAGAMSFERKQDGTEKLWIDFSTDEQMFSALIAGLFLIERME